MFKNIFLLIFLPFFMIACDTKAAKNAQLSIVVAEAKATAVATSPIMAAVRLEVYGK